MPVLSLPGKISAGKFLEKGRQTLSKNARLCYTIKAVPMPERYGHAL